MCYPYLRHYAATKLDSRSERCAFIGYSAFHHGYQCISMISGSLYISQDVIFTENVYPFADTSINNHASTESPRSAQSILGPSPQEASIPPLISEIRSSDHPFIDTANTSTSPSSDTKSTPISSSLKDSNLNSPSRQNCALNSPPGHIPSSNPLSPSNLDHQTEPSHTRTKPLSAIRQSLNNPPTSTEVRYPLPQCYSSTSNLLSDPLNYHSASTHSHWIQAMKDKYAALIRYRT